jgi:hypothetical protein
MPRPHGIKSCDQNNNSRYNILVLLIDIEGIIAGDIVVETHLKLKSRMSPWRRRLLDRAGTHVQVWSLRSSSDPLRDAKHVNRALRSVSYDKNAQFVRKPTDR